MENVLRKMLRQAVSIRLEHERELQTATTAASRAKQLLDESEIHAAKYSDLDRRINAYRAEQIKKWAAGGGDRPDGTELPIALKEEQTLKTIAKERVIASRQAYEALIAEENEAKAKFQEARHAAEVAAVEVAKMTGKEIAAKMIASQRTASLMRADLLALLYLNTVSRSGAIEPFPGGREIVDSINVVSPANLSPPEERAATTRWTEYLKALQIDADAQLPA